MNFEKSGELLDSAKTLIPSAAQTYSKSYRCFCEGAAPAFLERGDGCRVYDVDGNVYIDFLLGLGPVTIGYNDARINRAIISQINQGISFTLSHPIELTLARKIVDIIPCAQMVRFVKNGSDATAAAVRLARAHTGKDIILCSGYHGFQDWYIGTTVNDKGVPSSISQFTKTFEFNDIGSLEKAFQENRNQVAGVIMEPVTLQVPEKEYLQMVKNLCRENNAVLIFDEVITGFRVALGGAQEYFQVIPDLCAMGKGVANGMPLSFVAGRADIMKLIDQGAFISTTFGGETLSMAAALETIRIMETQPYFEHTWSLGERWQRKTAQLIKEKKAEYFLSIAGLAPHSGLVFQDTGTVSAGDLKSLFIQQVISKNILSLGVNNYCWAHSKEDIDEYVRAVGFAIESCHDAIDCGKVGPFLRGGRFNPVFKRNG